MTPFLLKPVPEAGPPQDYLLARVRCRRSQLDLSGGSDPWPGQTPEEGVQAACRWVFERMNPSLSRHLRPYLELIAAQSLIHALRLSRAEKRERLGHLLQRSLLHPLLQKQLLAATSFEALTVFLEQWLAPQCPAMSGLVTTYQAQGPGGLEEQLEAGLLGRSVAAARSRPVRRLLTWLVDRRNLLTLAKYRRWQVEQDPPLLPGGTVSGVRLQRLWRLHDTAWLDLAARRIPGFAEPPDADPRSIEMCLLQGISKDLRRLGRDPLGPGVLVDYLWRCQIAARNRALFLNLGEEQDELLNETLVMV